MIKLIDLLNEIDIPKNTWKPFSGNDIENIEKDILSLIQNAYGPIGGHPNYKSVSDLAGSDYEVIDLDDDPQPDALNIYKKKPAGMKSVGMGHDGSKKAKSSVIKNKVGKLKSRGWFAEVSGKMYGAYRRLIAQGVPEKDVINAIKGLGAAEEMFAAENLTKLSDAKLTDFLPINLLMSSLKTPDYENKFLGSAGAANILNKLNSITGRTTEETAKLKQEYVNKIISKNKGASQMFGPDLVKGITPEQFEEVLTGANIGNKNFDKNYYGTQADFYKLNQPTTSGGLADLASLDAQATNDPFLKQQIFDARNQLNVMGKDMFGNTQGGGGGGVNVPPPATDQTDSNNTYTYPDYNLIRQYRRDEGFTPNYLGGPEQMQLAGGYYDPTAQQFLFGGSGYGGSTNYIGDPQQYFSQGGMVDGKGLSGFKMKGF